MPGESFPEIARQFNMKGYSTVSSTFGRVQAHLAQDKGFMRRVEKIKKELTKGQREI